MLQSAFGLIAFVAIAWLFSEDRKAVKPRVVAAGVLLQLALGLALFKIPALREGLFYLNAVVETLDAATKAGTSFVFGYLGGAPTPFDESSPGASFILAFQALPIIIVTSAFAAVLFHWRIIPVIVRAFSALLQRTMGIGGALGVGCAANIFAGMVESPLFIRPYVAAMTRSELFTLMTCGMATIAGTMIVLYANVIGPVLPGALGHIMVASIISAPAAIVVAGVLVPETGTPTLGDVTPPQETHSTMDALVKGTTSGVQLLINVLALLVVLVATVHVVNLALGLLPAWNGEAVTLERLLGLVMAPLVWLAGVPWSEAHTAGGLMGTKIVLNEFLAYLNMAGLPQDALSGRSELIMTYALCGFANFGSLGIMIAGLSAIAPTRRDEIVGLGLKSIAAGALATLMTGAVVGILH